MSAPAENALSPAPVMTIAAMESSSSSSLIAASISRYMARFSAFSTLGRFMVIVPTPSSLSKTMNSYDTIHSPPLR